ncbi:hypothetical protein F9C11_40875 [Amycolatopsis sp. VS8301801F10]|uniref:hypothetical protein n=1 Tax=Amycolatopsis sp. VS8301801F10 TaxID=2652442 RepID=UPI0038FD17FB
MDTTDQVANLWLSLRTAHAMDHGAERTALLVDAVRTADRLREPQAAFRSRRMLAEAYRLDGQWVQTRRLLFECLDAYDQRRWQFDRNEEAELLGWYAWLVECMVDFPDVSLAEIRSSLRGVEDRYTAAGLPQHEIYSAQRGVAAHLGDWPTADKAYLRWVATAPTDEDDRWLDVIAIDHYLGKGDVARARRIAAGMLENPVSSGEPVALARCLMLLPLARAGEWDLAALTFRRIRRAMFGEFYSPENLGRIIEFCALTGNTLAGVDWLAAMAGFEKRQRPFGTMEFAASAAVLASALVRAGRGDTVLDLGPEDPNTVPLRVLARRMRRLALDLADQFDRRNGNTFQGDRIRARLAAEPLTDFLPLEPTSRPPLNLLPPPGLSDEALLARAEWHDLRCEADEARACLTLVPDDLPPHLSARLIELRAKFFQSEETEPALRYAIDLHYRYHDEPRALLAECWLSLWTAHAGRPDEAVASAAAAVEQLRRSGNDTHCAWGEYWLAYLLASQGAHADALAALARGQRHAEAASDHLARGTLLILDATLRPSLATATAALDALITARAPEKALEALEQLTHHDGYLEVLDTILAAPPPGMPRLIGRMRYLRGCSRPNPADSVDDFAEAIGQAALRGEDTAEQWHQLAQANLAAGRCEDAIDASQRATELLAPESDASDQARYLLADSYRHLGDHRAALREYRRLADGDGPLAAQAFVAGAALLEQLGLTE